MQELCRVKINMVIFSSHSAKCPCKDFDKFEQAPDVAHEWLVLGSPHMLLFPATVAEVVEAGKISAEVGALLHAAQ